MTDTEKVKLYKSLCTLPYPVAHTTFKEVPEVPNIVYFDETVNTVAAHSKNVTEFDEIRLELYSLPTQTAEAEQVVQAFLDEFTTYSKARAYIDSEALNVTYYRFKM